MITVPARQVIQTFISMSSLNQGYLTADENVGRLPQSLPDHDVNVSSSKRLFTRTQEFNLCSPQRPGALSIVSRYIASQPSGPGRFSLDADGDAVIVDTPHAVGPSAATSASRTLPSRKGLQPILRCPPPRYLPYPTTSRTHTTAEASSTTAPTKHAFPRLSTRLLSSQPLVTRPSSTSGGKTRTSRDRHEHFIHGQPADIVDILHAKRARLPRPVSYFSTPGIPPSAAVEKSDDLQSLFDNVSNADPTEHNRLIQNYNETHGEHMASIEEVEEADQEEQKQEKLKQAASRPAFSHKVMKWLASSSQYSTSPATVMTESRERALFVRSADSSLHEYVESLPFGVQGPSILEVCGPNPQSRPLFAPSTRPELGPPIAPSTRSSASPARSDTPETPLGLGSKKPWHYISSVLKRSRRKLCVFLKPCTEDIVRMTSCATKMGLISYSFTKTGAIINDGFETRPYEYGRDWWIIVTKDEETFEEFNMKRSKGWNPGEFGANIGRLGWGCDTMILEREFDLVEKVVASGKEAMLPAQFMAGRMGAMVIWCSTGMIR